MQTSLTADVPSLPLISGLGCVQAALLTQNDQKQWTHVVEQCSVDVVMLPLICMTVERAELIDLHLDTCNARNTHTSNDKPSTSQPKSHVRTH